VAVRTAHREEWTEGTGNDYKLFFYHNKWSGGLSAAAGNEEIDRRTEEAVEAGCPVGKLLAAIGGDYLYGGLGKYSADSSFLSACDQGCL